MNYSRRCKNKPIFTKKKFPAAAATAAAAAAAAGWIIALSSTTESLRETRCLKETRIYTEQDHAAMRIAPPSTSNQGKSETPPQACPLIAVAPEGPLRIRVAGLNEPAVCTLQS